jgi:hypothetical protein
MTHVMRAADARRAASINSRGHQILNRRIRRLHDEHVVARTFSSMRTGVSIPSPS